jgi:DNA-binding protein YbaB
MAQEIERFERKLGEATAALERRSFGGRDPERLAHVRLNGDLSLSSLELDAEALGIDAEQAKRITSALGEAFTAANEKAKQRLRAGIGEIADQGE